jgi:phosphate:Na+ symporter
MKTMSAGVAPLKGSGTLEAILTFTDGTSFGGALLGVLISTAITGVIQSSGATIGMLFALASAGVIKDVGQALPLVLGAHIGTCATALLGSVGTNIEARRSAVAHLVFNVIGAVIALALLRPYLWILPQTSPDTVRQIANGHTLVQLVNVLLFLPFYAQYARFIERITPSKARRPEHTHLDDRYLATPEAAIVAAMKEARRMAALARRTLIEAMRGFVKMTDAPFALVARSEQAIDELKRTVLEYLLRVAAHRLSRRQAVLVQQIQSAVVDIERIGDHASLLVELVTDKVQRKVWFDDECMNELIALYQKAEEILRLTEQSLDPTLDKEARRELAERIIERRDGYAKASRELHERQRRLVLEKCQDAMTGMIYARFVACLDKIVRHSKTIAFTELEPLFFVKPHKLAREAESVERGPFPEKVAPVPDELFPPEED